MCLPLQASPQVADWESWKGKVKPAPPWRDGENHPEWLTASRIDVLHNSFLSHRSAVGSFISGTGLPSVLEMFSCHLVILFSLHSGTPARPCWELPTLSSMSPHSRSYFSSLSLSCTPSYFPGYILACALRWLLFQFNNHTFYFRTSISFRPPVSSQKSILTSQILFLLLYF